VIRLEVDDSHRECPAAAGYGLTTEGHAIWHVLSALCLFAAYFHYRQFEPELA
jgi:hypothetical protein